MGQDRVETFELRRIGEILAEEGRFELRIDKTYWGGIRGLADFSHVVVSWWAHRAPDHDATDTLIVRETPYRDGPTSVGVFSTRSPERPSRLGISTCAITTIDELAHTIGLGWIDAVDGTPVVDIKPYFPSSDRVRDAVMPAWCAEWPSCLEDSATYDWNTALLEP